MSDLTWKTIDPATLSSAQRKAYDAYKTSYKAASEARKAFEALVISDAAKALPTGKTILFAYRFGQLGMAVADAKAAKSTSNKAQSLADYLKSAA